MRETTESLRRKIESAGDLQSVVRTMKALAASSIGQYENSVRALADYYRTVELGLSACFRGSGPPSSTAKGTKTDPDAVGAVVFGSDQGLVGQFNEIVADDAMEVLGALHGRAQVWAVGQRVYARLADAGLPLMGLFPVPSSVQAIAPLVGQILVAGETHHGRHEITELHLFYNRSTSAAVYAPVRQRLLPLDDEWRRELMARPWPTKLLPEVLGDHTATLRSFIRGYLFVSLFRACAESLASENASRLAAMERADKNIDELLETLKGTFHRLRQTGIDEELFDVVSGFEALPKARSESARHGRGST
jgi:F-type H+-transporting ATPase subunit gamma